MAWLVVVTVLVTMVSLAHGDAGHFFAELPKNLPRIGRRGDIPALASISRDDSRSQAKTMGEMTEALAQLDSDGDGSVGIAELLRIPVIRVAILLQNPALLTPAATTDTEDNNTSDVYAADRRPVPHLLPLRYLQK